MINNIVIAQAEPTAPAAVPAAPAPAAAAPAAETQATTVQPVGQAPTEAELQQQEGSLFNMLLPFVLIALIFYFLIIRPQKKQQQEMKERQDGLKVGDKVMTAGGLYGVIREVLSTAVRLEVAPNVIIKVDKRSIAANIGKDGSPENETK